MFSNRNSVRLTLAAIATGLAMISAPAVAQDATQQAYDEMTSIFGGVPGFMQMYPKEAVPGAWALVRDFMIAETALDPKTKALISLAVAAQIPCSTASTPTRRMRCAPAQPRSRCTRRSPSPA